MPYIALTVTEAGHNSSIKCSKPGSNSPQRDRRATRNFYESKCATLDRQIDRLVYDLYELTPDEIAIVEGTGQ
jgi:hypothetical protein